MFSPAQSRDLVAARKTSSVLSLRKYISTASCSLRSSISRLTAALGCAARNALTRACSTRCADASSCVSPTKTAFAFATRLRTSSQPIGVRVLPSNAQSESGVGACAISTAGSSRFAFVQAHSGNALTSAATQKRARRFNEKQEVSFGLFNFRYRL